jgi:hypothetical protein
LLKETHFHLLSSNWLHTNASNYSLRKGKLNAYDYTPIYELMIIQSEKKKKFVSAIGKKGNGQACSSNE